MEKTTYLASLLLVLLLSFLSTGCNTNRLTTHSTFKSSGYYKVEVLYLPDDPDFNFPDGLEKITMQPSVWIDFIHSGRMPGMNLTFRIADHWQLEILKSQLSTSGMIERLTVTPIGN